jgi:hypothetical protein
MIEGRNELKIDTISMATRGENAVMAFASVEVSSMLKNSKNGGSNSRPTNKLDHTKKRKKRRGMVPLER